MVPHFRDNNYNEGMYAGIGEVTSLLSNPEYYDELRSEMSRSGDDWQAFKLAYYIVGSIIFLIAFFYNNSQGFANSQKPKNSKHLAMRLKRWEWVVEFGLVPAFIPIYFEFTKGFYPILFTIGAVYVYFILTLVHKRIRMNSLVSTYDKKYFKITELFSHYQTFWLVMGILFPVPMLLHYFIYVARKNFYRNHPRNCPQCDSPMQKLDEQADDEYLKKNQVFEEQLKSVDYDVWLCSNCQHTSTYNFVSRSTKYSACPKCKTMALYTKSTRTVVSATYESTGTGEKVEECKFCKKQVVSSYSIPMLTRSSNSDGSSGGSSSGGSWGGGSSGGGGASSSW
jgi:uncharacterized protein